MQNANTVSTVAGYVNVIVSFPPDIVGNEKLMISLAGPVTGTVPAILTGGKVVTLTDGVFCTLTLSGGIFSWPYAKVGKAITRKQRIAVTA